jgi:hypothetical protein
LGKEKMTQPRHARGAERRKTKQNKTKRKNLPLADSCSRAYGNRYEKKDRKLGKAGHTGTGAHGQRAWKGGVSGWRHFCSVGQIKKLVLGWGLLVYNELGVISLFHMFLVIQVPLPGECVFSMIRELQTMQNAPEEKTKHKKKKHTKHATYIVDYGT